MLCLIAVHETALVEAAAGVRQRVISPAPNALILLDVDTANTEGGEEVIEGLASGSALEEGANAANGLDEVLVGSGVVDK